MKYFLSLVTLLIASCAPLDGSESKYSAAEIEEAQFPLTAVELSNLVMGGTYRVTQGYQPNRVHAGIDFGGITNNVTRVNSPVNGTIIANTAACGKVAVYDGRNTIIMAHMSNRTPLAVGSAVTMGTYLGTTSNVGGGGCVVDGAHLHMEIRNGREPNFMSVAANDNRNRNQDPLTYAYPAFPAVALTGPANGFATANSPINFSWSPIQGANAYRLQISTTNRFDANTCLDGCVYNTAAGTTARSVALNRGNFFWRVRAGNSGQGGQWSAVRSLTRR